MSMRIKHAQSPKPIRTASSVSNMANHIFYKLLNEFCAQSSMHGFNHIVAPKRHILERLIWLIIIILAGATATALILRSYQRYQTDPTVISIDRSKRVWSTPLPATTFCFENRFDETKARNVIQEIWNPTNSTEYEYYEDFLSCLANATYNTIQDCSKFVNNDALNSLNLNELMYKVNFDLRGLKAAAFYSEDIVLQETHTDQGICYSLNSLISRYFHYGQNNLSAKFRPPLCTNPEKLCYARLFNLARSILFYVHSPFDVPRISDNARSPQGFNLALTYLSLRTESSRRVRLLKKSQRRCLFFNEQPTSGTPFYTYDLCINECRRALALKFCKCVPFFYKQRNNQTQCRVKDIPCLISNADELESLIDQKTGEKHSCDCVPNCSTTVYFQTSLKKLKIDYIFPQNSTQYEYYLEALPQMQLKRDVLYNAEDLLVAWGGIAAFFLGCSIISGIEIVYFFTIRLLRYFGKRVEKERQRRQRNIFFKLGKSYTNHPMTRTSLELPQR